MRIGQVVSSFSLWILASVAVAGPFADLNKELQTASPQKAANLVRNTTLMSDTNVQRAVSGIISSKSDALRAKHLETLQQATRLAAEFEASAQNSDGVKSDIDSIKRSPLYNNPKDKEQQNWLYKALERFSQLFRFNPPRSNITAPNVNLSPIIVVAWVLLGLAVLAFAILAIRHFRWKFGLQRRAKALLEDDEPERTVDEWLQLATELAAAGKYREAVRGLYLACLLRLDEHGVARFERGETNWEHLVRIQASPKRPTDLDFHTVTREFDRIWYGFHVRGESDYELFRQFYVSVTEALRTRRAA